MKLKTEHIDNLEKMCRKLQSHAFNVLHNREIWDLWFSVTAQSATNWHAMRSFLQENDYSNNRANWFVILKCVQLRNNWNMQRRRGLDFCRAGIFIMPKKLSIKCTLLSIFLTINGRNRTVSENLAHDTWVAEIHTQSLFVLLWSRTFSRFSFSENGFQNDVHLVKTHFKFLDYAREKKIGIEIEIEMLNI